MQTSAVGARMRLRPHAKTHKSIALARQQIARGAVGICCAKLGEAEVFAAAGIEDIRLPYPLNPVNADRVVALLDRTRLSFIVDDLDCGARLVAGAAARGRATVDVLVKVDVGLSSLRHRSRSRRRRGVRRAQSPSCRGCGSAGC